MRASRRPCGFGPLRAVVSSSVRVGRGSVLGPDTSRRVRWWHCELECGHIAEPKVRYARAASGSPRANGWHPRPLGAALPAPKRCRCSACRPTNPPGAAQ